MVPQAGPGTAAPFNLNQFLWDPRTTDFTPNTSGTAALTGVVGTTGVGTVGSLGGGSANPTGVSATGSVGTVSAVSLSLALIGVSGSSSDGSVFPSDTILLTGLLGTGGVGNAAPGASSFALPITGVTSTGSVGSVISPTGTPSIVGLTLADAMTALAGANLQIGSIIYYFGRVAYAVPTTQGGAIVLTQFPAPGTILSTGASVNVTVTFDLTNAGAVELSPASNNNHLSGTESKILPL
jgi:hypothetical protein